MAADIFETVADNFMVIFFAILTLIIVVAVLKLLNAWVDERKTRTVAQFETDMAKLEIAKRKAVMEELRNSAVVLNESEREKLEKIRTDTAILNRRLIFDMNEVEDRTRRLEVAADSANVGRVLGDVRSKERSLFGSGRR